jgi:hypothetical protein
MTASDTTISTSSISSNAAAQARERDLAKRAASLAAATREAITPSDVARILVEAADDVDAMVIQQKSQGEIHEQSTTTRQRAQGIEASLVNTVLGSPQAAMLSCIPPLEFESRFECGNLCAAVRTGPFEYEITIDLDINTPGHTQWFFFRVRNMVAHDATLTIDKSGSGSYQKKRLFPLPEPHMCVADNTYTRSKRRDALLPASYTIEASFAGPDTGTRKGIHFSTRMYEDVGHAFCVALLDFLEGAGGTRSAAAINSLKR